MTATTANISLLNVDRDTTLEASSAYCGEITRLAARNFYHGLKLLPEPKRSQMYALYAYMRMLDDIADADDGRNLQQRIDDLDAWRELTWSVIDGQSVDNGERSIWPAFADLVRSRSIPRDLFDSAIAGQDQDLRSATFDTFEQLHEYCYQVAGVVGIASVYVWGFTGGPATLDLAIKRGVAFQLTNILRDLRSDAEAGRTYLPRQELAAAGVTEAQIRAAQGGPAFVAFIRQQIDRANRYYEESAALESRIDRDSRATLVAMTGIYRGLLRKITKDPERILRERVSLSFLDKIWIASQAKRASRARY